MRVYTELFTGSEIADVLNLLAKFVIDEARYARVKELNFRI